ncbi:hypothetical protein [Sphingomonas sp. KR3-1]|uniref:hypothetical protein n=1 Tax=Sphingomonas sp. KR3-1 TaxID=3156611 RepID=UPI0032B5F000
MAGVIPSAGMQIGIGLSVWLRMFDFRGRSTRSEAAYFLLVNIILFASVMVVIWLSGWM